MDLSERQRISLLNSPDAEDIFSFKKDLKRFLRDIYEKMGLNRNIYVDIWGLEGTGRKKLESKKLEQ